MTETECLRLENQRLKEILSRLLDCCDVLEGIDPKYFVATVLDAMVALGTLNRTPGSTPDDDVYTVVHG